MFALVRTILLTYHLGGFGPKQRYQQAIVHNPIFGLSAIGSGLLIAFFLVREFS
jgi:hypothetical protein